MAGKREPVKRVESESEEDDEASSEEVDSQESESESEPEQMPMAISQKKLQVPVKTEKPSRPPPPPQKQATSSSGEEESGSETESESDGPDPIVKPVVEAQKSSDGASKARPKPKPNAPEPVTPTKPSAAKRSAEDTTTKDAKKSKKTAEPETSSEKKPNLFQRLWTEEDEIVILRGMIDYSNKKKLDPISDLDGFHDFIKKNLHTDFSRTQLQDKIRRLKKKYVNNKGKEKEGKERAFSKPHEQNAYDLSKEIWGNETGKVNGGAGESEDVKKTVVVSGEGEKSLSAKSLYSSSIGASMEERMLIDGRQIYEMGQGLEGKKEWEKLRLEELQLYLKQLEVRVAQTKLVLNVIKGGDH